MSILVRASGFVLAVGIIIGVLYVRAEIQDVRSAIFVKQEQLERRLQGASHQSRLRNELVQRSHDIDRLRSFLAQRGDFGNVVGLLEQEAARNGVEIRIPDVIEGGDTESNHEVRMEVSVTGDPRAVLQFMHRAEHIPYLAHIESFHFTGRAANSAVSSFPSLQFPSSDSGSGEAGGEAPRVVSVPARLTFAMIVFTRP